MAATTEYIFKLRLAVARFGEMDRAKWWNSKGMLAEIGAMAVGRGLPQSHLFARARAVFAVAGQRCDEVYNAPEAFTLWKLPAEVEEQIDDAWPHWLEDPQPWSDFLALLNEQSSSDLLEVLANLDLAGDQLATKHKTASGR